MTESDRPIPSQLSGVLSQNYMPDVERYLRKGPHIGHKMHLCELAERGETSMERFKLLVKNSRFICRSCGRAAAKEENLCDPVPLE